jgi:hypothetical protein
MKVPSRCHRQWCLWTEQPIHRDHSVAAAAVEDAEELLQTVELGAAPEYQSEAFAEAAFQDHGQQERP